jgi:hypothetical protein
MTSRLRAILAIAILVGSAACGDPTRPRADIAVVSDTVELFALNGSLLSAPIGFSILGGSLAPLDFRFAFDVAVDLDDQGRILLYPVRLVANNLARTSLVGIQRVERTYEELTLAPQGGYRGDSVTVLQVGQVAAVEYTSILSGEPCTFALAGRHLYGKFVVDSIDRAARKLYSRLTTNPNCGFRSLVPGVPRE